ncbi:MAG: hypothetical protein HFJ46_00015 [Clostridia bacterium]|nr:hypothetical protein [Clostridia bacterium]
MLGNLKIKTWSRKIDKIYAFRDFEIFNENNEKIGIATSKWIFIDIDTGKLTKVTGEIENKYETESINVFEDEIEKLQMPDTFDKECRYKITKNLIDVNRHVHNIFYLDIAKEIIPDEIYNKIDFNFFEIMYKKEIKYPEEVRCLFKEEKDNYIIVIKSEKDESVHSIIKLYK